MIYFYFILLTQIKLNNWMYKETNLILIYTFVVKMTEIDLFIRFDNSSKVTAFLDSKHRTITFIFARN